MRVRNTGVALSGLEDKIIKDLTKKYSTSQSDLLRVGLWVLWLTLEQGDTKSALTILESYSKGK